MTEDRIARAREIAEGYVELGHPVPPEHARTLLAALASLPDDPWQPIETAPDSCEERLLWVPCDLPEGGYHCLGSQTVEGEWRSDEGKVHPTHWQPLPAPPAAIRKATA